MNRILRLLNTLHEDGLYVLVASRIDSLLSSMRNRLISRKLGVAKISIGARPFLRGLSSIEMGKDFSAADSLWLIALTRYNEQNFSPKIIIGNHVRVSRQVQISATNFVEIGDNVLIGSGALITDNNHGRYAEEHTSPHISPALRPLDHNRRVVIGKNVWLGAGVVVAPDSVIGEGTVIGANSVVTGSISPFSIASGAASALLPSRLVGNPSPTAPAYKDKLLQCL